MNKISIYYSFVKQEYQNDLFRIYKDFLGEKIITRSQKFINRNTRHQFLTSKYVLIESLKKNGLSGNLTCLKYSPNNKPYLENSPDFNISHSHNMVITAIAPSSQIGVDVEHISNVCFEHLTDSMSTKQWDTINKSALPNNVFYQYWSIKESVIKASGDGYNPDFRNIEIFNNFAIYKYKKWFYKCLSISNEYTTVVSSSSNIDSISCEEIIL